jgi:SAM-dependent methyltransferase
VLNRCYNQQYWHRSGGHNGKLLERFFKLRMRGTMAEINRWVVHKGRSLDWGSGDGALVRLLNEAGYDSYGIDLYSHPPHDARLINAEIEQAPFESESFELITCLHVLEHVKEIRNSVKAAFKLLKPGGIFMGEVPNISSFQYKLFGKKWQPLEIPLHVNHFDPNTLSKLFIENVNCKILKMSFFSHRVSPSALVLSVFPVFTPKLVRRKYKGKYPGFLKLLYLLLQLTVYPIALTEACCKRGAIVRFCLKKKG